MDGRSVLVAGATGGLGSAIASDLAGRGARLTLVARSAERLEALTVPGRRVALDLRTPGSAAAAVAAAREHGGGLHAVVNAVGVVAFGPFEALSIDTMEELFLTNTFLPMMLTQAALAALGEGGVILNISGAIAERNLAGMAAYGASKAALLAFDQAVAREARRRKIRLIDARPPHTETGLAGRAIEGVAPNFGVGLDPAIVAGVIVDAIAGNSPDLPSSAFSTR